MRKYYVFYGQFANQYRLYYTENDSEKELLPKNAKRIRRKEAQRLAREESYRRKYDHAFSGFADSFVRPAFVKGCGDPDDYKVINRIAEYVGY